MRIAVPKLTSLTILDYFLFPLSVTENLHYFFKTAAPRDFENPRYCSIQQFSNFLLSVSGKQAANASQLVSPSTWAILSSQIICQRKAQLVFFTISLQFAGSNYWGSICSLLRFSFTSISVMFADYSGSIWGLLRFCLKICLQFIEIIAD